MQGRNKTITLDMEVIAANASKEYERWQNAYNEYNKCTNEIEKLECEVAYRMHKACTLLYMKLTGITAKEIINYSKNGGPVRQNGGRTC